MSYDMPDLLEEDVGALVSGMLTDDSTILPIENSVAEKFNIANNDKSIEALPCLDGNDQIYNDLGDLNNWAELMDNGLNLSTNQDVGYTPMGDGSAFLEFSDLNISLGCAAESSEFELVQTDNIYATLNPFRNLDGSYCEGEQETKPLL